MIGRHGAMLCLALLSTTIACKKHPHSASRQATASPNTDTVQTPANMLSTNPPPNPETLPNPTAPESSPNPVAITQVPPPPPVSTAMRALGHYRKPFAQP